MLTFTGTDSEIKKITRLLDINQYAFLSHDGGTGTSKIAFDEPAAKRSRQEI